MEPSQPAPRVLILTRSDGIIVMLGMGILGVTALAVDVTIVWGTLHTLAHPYCLEPSHIGVWLGKYPTISWALAVIIPAIAIVSVAYLNRRRSAFSIFARAVIVLVALGFVLGLVMFLHDLYYAAAIDSCQRRYWD